MTHYNVITPFMTTHYYDEPPEIWQDYVSVDAKNKREAKVKAVQAFREKKSDWIAQGENPFKGLEVSEPLCEHGFCWCDICPEDPEWRECPECMKEWDADDN